MRLTRFAAFAFLVAALSGSAVAKDNAAGIEIPLSMTLLTDQAGVDFGGRPGR